MLLRPGTPEEAGMSPARVENLRRLGASWVEDGTHPALVLLVARRGVIVLYEAWGAQRPEPDYAPLQKDSILPMGSIAKTTTATCAMLLVEDGLLGLNRPVQEYVPEFEGSGKENVLVHHLLTHTSGLQDEDIITSSFRRGDVDDGLPADPDSTQDHFLRPAVEAICSARLFQPPGESMSYSTTGIILLGEVIRRVSGQALADFAWERLFEPLGMTDTAYGLPESLRPRRVRFPPDAKSDVGVTADAMNSLQRASIPWPDAGLSSTSLDIARFGQIFLDGGKIEGKRLLSAATVREMTRNQIPGIGTKFLTEYHKEASWGYGWAIKGFEKWRLFTADLDSPATFWHAGASGAYLWADPTYDLVGFCFGVTTQAYADGMPKHTHGLFVNAATAAVED
jgi:CubicO group peptidase (beta-lactamase class C family)